MNRTNRGTELNPVKLFCRERGKPAAPPDIANRRFKSLPASTEKKDSRKRDITFSLVSLLLAAAFFWASIWDFTRYGDTGSSWKFWESIPILALSLALFGFGISELVSAFRRREEDVEDPTQSREIVKMIAAFIILIIVILVMFYSGLR